MPKQIICPDGKTLGAVYTAPGKTPVYAGCPVKTNGGSLTG
jgi:hypothetical protein